MLILWGSRQTLKCMEAQSCNILSFPDIVPFVFQTMLDKEKKRFHEMAEKDKKRYDTEMQDYVPPVGDKRGKKRKQIKDPNAPKRSL